MRDCGWFASRLAASKPLDVMAARSWEHGTCLLLIEAKYRSEWRSAVKALIDDLGRLEEIAGQTGAVVLGVACAPPPARCRVFTLTELKRDSAGGIPEPTMLPTIKSLCDPARWCNTSTQRSQCTERNTNR